MFEKFETMSRAERERIADELTNLYAVWHSRENVQFMAMRHARTETEYDNAQRRWIAADASLSAIRAVFNALQIDEPAIPF